jgi:hypothetical protein
MSTSPMGGGRVISVYLLVLLGRSPLGGPLVGWLSSQGDGRLGMLVCGLAPAVAVMVVAVRLEPPLRPVPTVSSASGSGGRRP